MLTPAARNPVVAPACLTALPSHTDAPASPPSRPPHPADSKRAVFQGLLADFVPSLTAAALVFTTTACTIESSRGVRDEWNSVAGGFAGGACWHGGDEGICARAFFLSKEG